MPKYLLPLLASIVHLCSVTCPKPQHTTVLTNRHHTVSTMHKSTTILAFAQSHECKFVGRKRCVSTCHDTDTQSKYKYLVGVLLLLYICTTLLAMYWARAAKKNGCNFLFLVGKHNRISLQCGFVVNTHHTFPNKSHTRKRLIFDQIFCSSIH